MLSFVARGVGVGDRDGGGGGFSVANGIVFVIGVSSNCITAANAGAFRLSSLSEVPQLVQRQRLQRCFGRSIPTHFLHFTLSRAILFYFFFFLRSSAFGCRLAHRRDVFVCFYDEA